MEKPLGYPESPKESQAIIGRTKSWFWEQGEEDEASFEAGDKRDQDYYYSFDNSQSGTLLSDPRLTALVDFLRELFFQRKELFRQLHDQVLEAAKRNGVRLWRIKPGRNRGATVARSLSFGSNPRNEWIKVTTLTTVADGDDPAGDLDGCASATK